MYAKCRRLREFEQKFKEHTEVRETQHRTAQQHISWELTLPSTSPQSSLRRITDSRPVRIAAHYQDHSPSRYTVRAVTATVQFSRSSDSSFSRSSSSHVGSSGRQFLHSSRRSDGRLPSPLEKYNGSGPNTFSGTRGNRLPSYIGSVLTFQDLTDRHLKKKQKLKKNKGTGHTTPIRRPTARSQTSIMKECQLPQHQKPMSPLTAHSLFQFAWRTSHMTRVHPTPPRLQPVVRSHPDHGQGARRRGGLHREHGQDQSEAAPSE